MRAGTGLRVGATKLARIRELPHYIGAFLANLTPIVSINLGQKL